MPAYRADEQTFTKAVVAKYGPKETITRKEVEAVCAELNSDMPLWLIVPQERRVARGVYSLSANVKDSLRAGKSMREATKLTEPAAPAIIKPEPMKVTVPQVEISHDNSAMVPSRFPGYVPFGHYNDIRSIVKSGRFHTGWVTGLSGNGKTMMIEQVCAETKRELIRTNITKETDEDSLMGGFRMIDGNTVWQDGPVVTAMERGAILLLDEVDLGDAKMMCLQSVLEGAGYFMKRTNRMIRPTDGFNIFATANTKGQGSDDGRFIGTNVMNEAMLERFAITFEQEYPEAKIEMKILQNELAKDRVQDDEFADRLVTWADAIRKSFYEGAVNDVISTRRLVNIAHNYSIFGMDRTKAINLCLNRFDKETKDAFMSLYLKIDDKSKAPSEEPVVMTFSENDDTEFGV